MNYHKYFFSSNYICLIYVDIPVSLISIQMLLCNIFANIDIISLCHREISDHIMCDLIILFDVDWT